MTRFPTIEVPSHGGAERSSAKAPSAPAEGTAMGENVLLVDDEADIRKIALVTLRAVGKMNVTLAASGDEALELAQKGRFDIVLLDVMMPGMDGITTLSRLREIPACASVPVIFMTAKVQKSEIERYLRLGAAGVVRKPFDPMSLAEEIRGIVRAADPA